MIRIAPCEAGKRYSKGMRPTDLPHAVDEDGGHDLDECYPCLAAEEVRSECRCGACCRNLTLNACVEDAHVEPRIRELCAATRDHAGRLTGYRLNAADGPCTFLDRQTELCTIRETRPLMCRLFDCDGQDRDDLVQVGVLPPREFTRCLSRLGRSPP